MFCQNIQTREGELVKHNSAIRRAAGVILNGKRKKHGRKSQNESNCEKGTLFTCMK